MSVFWIYTSLLNHVGRNIGYAFEVDRVDTLQDFRSCLVKDGAIIGQRLDIRREADDRRRITSRRPVMLTMGGIAEVKPIEWVLTEGDEL